MDPFCEVSASAGCDVLAAMLITDGACSCPSLVVIAVFPLLGGFPLLLMAALLLDFPGA